VVLIVGAVERIALREALEISQPVCTNPAAIMPLKLHQLQKPALMVLLPHLARK